MKINETIVVSQKKTTSNYLLEAGTLNGLKASKQRTKALLKFYWNGYAELAHQRSLIADHLYESLIQTSISYELNHWQRAVKYEYGLKPLSTVGSLQFTGGRFNTGRDVNSEVPVFPALYIAENKETALQEHLGQEPIVSNSKLTPLELTLTNPSSETIVSISGKLDKVFDLTRLNTLVPFVELIKNFHISKSLQREARKLRVPAPNIIKTPEQLTDSLLLSTWRAEPTSADIPAPSQVFGHLVYSAGIEGILYQSKFTKKLCLALFPRNFSKTDSYIKLDDRTPHSTVTTKIDAQNWRETELLDCVT